MHQIFHNLCSIHVHVFLLNSEHERSDLDTRPPPQDPQSLRDEILNRPSSRQPHARKQPDEGQLATKIILLFDTLFIVFLFLNDYRSGQQVEYAVGIRRAT